MPAFLGFLVRLVKQFEMHCFTVADLADLGANLLTPPNPPFVSLHSSQ